MKGKSTRNWILAGVVVLAGAGIWAMTRSGQHDEVHAEVPVVSASTQAVEGGLIPEFGETQGTVRPRMEATLSPRIMSTVAEVLVREGDRVSKGQALVRLEAADLAAGVAQARAAVDAAAMNSEGARKAARMEMEGADADIAQAQAAVEQAKAHLQMARTGARRQERAQAELGVTQAKAQADLARAEADRMRRLFEQDVVSRQRLDHAEAAEKTAVAAWEAAKQQADMVGEGSRTEEIRASEERLRQAEASLAAARTRKISTSIREDQARAAASQTRQASAALKGAEVMQGYAILRAPFSGVVVIRHVDPGDQVGPMSPVITLEDRSQWVLESDISEKQAMAMRVGDEASAMIDSLGGEIVGAKILEIRPRGDSASRTVRVKAALEDNPRLKSGLFGRLRIDRGTKEGVLVPEAAVMDATGMARVWTVSSDGVAHLQVVKLGRKSGDRYVVLSGLSKGQKVVVSNLAAVKEGAKIREAAR